MFNERFILKNTRQIGVTTELIRKALTDPYGVYVVANFRQKDNAMYKASKHFRDLFYDDTDYLKDSFKTLHELREMTRGDKPRLQALNLYVDEPLDPRHLAEILNMQDSEGINLHNIVITNY